MARKAFSAYALVGALLAAGYFVIPKGGVAYDIWYLSVGISSGIAILVGARLNRTSARRAWEFIALGQLLFAAGDAVYLVYSLRGLEVPYPSAADVFYLCGYPAIGIGLLLLIRARSPGRDTVSLIDAAIATTGIAFFSWIFLISPYTGDGSLAGEEKVLAALYPLMDVGLAAIALRLMIGAGARVFSFNLLASALLLQLVADGIYLLGSVEGWYIDGSRVDLVWVAAYISWGLAALHPSMAKITQRLEVDEEELTKRRLVVLTLVTLVTPGLMLAQSVRRSDIDVFLMVVASTTLFALVIARLAGVVTRHDKAKRREARLRRAAADLVATRTREGIYRIAVETALSISETRPLHATRTTLSLGGPDGMTIVAASGTDSDGLVGRRVDDVPVPVRVALEAGSIGSFVGPAEVGAGGLKEGERLLVFPLEIKGQCRGGLWIRTGAALQKSVQHALQTLAAQVALALESIALTEDLLERESERRFRRLVQNSTDVIVVLEHDLTVRFATPSARTVLQIDADDLVGTNLAKLLRPEEIDSLVALLGDLGGRTVTYDIDLRRADGEWLAVESVWSDLTDDDEVSGIVMTAHDVTGRRQLESQLIHQAFHDPLTGLANRQLFNDRVTHALERSQRSGEQLAVLFIDLVDFKTVNDSLGHATGDELLVGVSARLESCLRTGDTCARLGGDEFGILLEGVRPPEEAEEVAARNATAFDAPFAMSGTDLYARMSIGVAVGATASSASELLRNADVAMYRAKADPSSRVEMFEPGMNADALDRLELRADLEHAVVDGGFVVHYQPIVSLETGRVVGLEALVRWEHPNRGLLPPVMFVPLAEETGLIGRVGGFVLKDACKTVAAWQRTIPGAARLRLNVNISGHQLEDTDFPQEVSAALTQSGLAPADLMLELTESVLMGDGELAAARLERLKHLGVGIAIDDFGTGFSSLSYLHRFPVDTLKIAKPFVDRVGRDDNGRLAGAIISLGESLKLEVVAEGIEEAEQRDGLRALGCALGQGYYFSRPLSAPDMQQFLERRLRSAA